MNKNSVVINEERLKNTFIELVSVPCPSLDEKEEAALLIQKLKDLGMDPQLDDSGEKCGGSTGNVWGFLQGNVPGAVRLFFEAHMDSVAPTTGTKVIEKDGVLYSDGTTTLGGDDKSGIAAVLEALQCVVENDLPHGDLQVCFTIAEETGSYGVRYMDKTKIRADAGYCMDSNGHPGEIKNASPKAINVKLKVRGKSAHAGMEPEKGINAIMLAAEALHALPAYGRLDEETTLNVDLISGGLASNIVPEFCELVIDMRCPDEEKLERLKEETVALFRNTVEAGGGTLEVELKNVAPGVNLNMEHATVKLAAAAAEKLGFPVSTGFTGGCSDANFLCGMGLPSVLLATGMDKIHTTEECLALEDLSNAARWVLGIITEATVQANSKM
jgi:tripeptide aminopeptidase